MESKAFVRRCFRVQVREGDPVAVKIYGLQYQCVEISDGGVGILLEEEDIFWSVSQAVGVELFLEENRFELQGVIVHISLGAAGGRYCGIMFRAMTDDVRKALYDYVMRERRKLFSLRPSVAGSEKE